MRKPKKFYATRGHLTAEGATKAEAKDKLTAMVDWACQAGHPKIECRFGLIIVVAATANGWTHTIVDPADMRHGKGRHAACCYGQADHYTDVLDCARSHAAQWAWNAGVADDDAFVADAGCSARRTAELRSWVGFQRRYIAEKSAGRSDADAFARASGDPRIAA